MIALEQLCYASGLRRKNAMVKFAYAVATLLVCVVSRSPAAALVSLLANALLTVGKGGVPLRQYLHFMALPLAFLLLSTVALVLHWAPAPLDLFALRLGSGWLTGSRAGLAYAARLVVTALAGVSCLYFLAMTTPMPDLLHVLERLHCPALLCELMLLLYRAVFVLLDTASRLTVAQRCRLGDRDFPTALRSFGGLGTALMIRVVGRSQALYTAMEARGYEGRLRVLHQEYPARRRDVVLLCAFELGLLLLAEGRFWPWRM